MEGVIKYRCDWNRISPDIITEDGLDILNIWRSQLIKEAVIGQNDEGVGFGNISYRLEGSNYFLITGSQTGHLPVLTKEHIALIEEFSIEKNYVKCSGLTKASSETLSHAVFYSVLTKCNAVIHIHSKKIWMQARGSYRTTAVEALYGTPELARSIIETLNDSSAAEEQIIIMGGHQEGIMIYGNTLDQAGTIALELVDKYKFTKNS